MIILSMHHRSMHHRRIRPSYLAVLSFVASGFSLNAAAVMPIINAIDDQKIAIGSSYIYTPALNQGGVVNWSKLYGPDDVKVDPITGTVTWSVPSNLPSESFHIGVQAANADGVAREVWIVHAGVANVIEVGPNAALKTLRSGFAAMKSGDTLVVKAGTYTGINNTFGNYGTEKPPTGNSSKLTTVMSEQPGSVILDGEGERDPLILSSDFVTPLHNGDGTYPSSPANYIALKGIEVHNSNNAGLEVRYAHHIKLIDMGSSNSGGKYQQENVANAVINRSQYVTVEGLYTWGYSRYPLNLYYSEYVVSRRNNVRGDNFAGAQPIAGFQTYCSRHIRHENNIVVDSDQPEFWLHNIYWGGAFSQAATNCYDLPEDVHYERSIALNNAFSVGDTAATESKDSIRHQDIVAWDADIQRFDHGTNDAFISMYNSRGSMQISQSTIGNLRQSGGPIVTGGQSFIFATDKAFSVSNSIFFKLGEVNGTTINQGPLINCQTSVCSFTDNIFYNFKGAIPSNAALTPMVRNTTNNPNLRYLPKLDPQSPLRTAGAGNTRIGAEVMTYKGRSGTFWGETGFDDETNVPMWPIANEHVIGKAMGKWSYTGPTRNNGPVATLNGARGFAVSGQTLTNYIWSYLGNLPPVFNFHAQGGNTKVALLWDLPATKSLSSISGYRVYRIDNGQQTLIKEINDRNAFNITIEGLNNSTQYQFAVTSFNNSQESTYAYIVNIMPMAKAKPMTPSLSVKVI